ncbi:MAG: FMN-binding protein [Bacilli bacterium]
MKKILSGLLVIALCLALVGCGEGKYKEGTYEGSVTDNYGGEENTATAKVEVDKNGKISSVYLDTTYTKDGISTTKKALKDNYGMKSVSANMGKIEGGKEWYEQAEALEKAVVEKQGIDFITLDKDGKTDAVSGCTIKIEALYKALEQALNKAKK